MTTRKYAEHGLATMALVMLAALPLAAFAQTPVDDDGKVIGSHESASASPSDNIATGNEDIPLMSDVDLEDLVGPIALYPDDLLAIVLPAAAYPLQLIDAARFLEEMESDKSLKPDPEWDDSVVALLNYPEVIELLNDDIDWTWRLGEAVVAQQGDVVAAIETFRDRAYAAGNLKSDSYQNVTREEGVIEITPVSEDVIYVPYYEPERVVVYQPRPVYYYYPRSYPVYYYPYSSAYDFNRGYFWGVTTAFTIGWMTDSLHVYHHSYSGHPYYGRSYWDRWWYRRPNINVYNTTYSRNTNVTINRYYHGDIWRPRRDRGDYVRDQRVTYNRHYQPQRSEHRAQQRTETRSVRRQEPITFRSRQSDGRRSERQEPASQNRQQRAPDARASQQRRTAPTQRAQERREPEIQARQQRRQTPTQRVQERREPQRVATLQRREAPAQQRQERPATAIQQRQERRVAPTQRTQRTQERSEPVRQTRSPQRSERATPQRQERRESKPEPKRVESNRSSESRSGSGRRSERRASN